MEKEILRYCIMGEYTEELKEVLKQNRKCKKEVFKLVGRIYRGVNNNRFTFTDIYKMYENI